MFLFVMLFSLVSALYHPGNNEQSVKRQPTTCYDVISLRKLMRSMETVKDEMIF